MRKCVLSGCLCLLAGAVSASTINYSVAASWTGIGGLSTSAVMDNINASVGNPSDVLSLIFVPTEPGGAVTSPSNTAWGSLYLEDSTIPTAPNFDAFSFSGVVLTLQLTDLSTSESVIYTGTLSGGYSASSAGNSSSGSISWSPTGLQTLPPPSTVTFLTDSSDPIGLTLDDGTFSKPASTVNGTVASSAVNGVPEPATLALMGVGLLCVGMVNRRRRQN